MKLSDMLAVIFIICTPLLAPSATIAYFGLVYCFLLGAVGTALGIWNISTYVSGTSIKSPNVGNKSILGTVICEANFLSAIITCILSYNIIKAQTSIIMNYFYYSSFIFVGICSYYSSIATSLICGVISMMDGLDPNIFYKVVALEIMPASIGLIGFILGILMNSKAEQFMKNQG